jgi:hypothetical protein
MASCLTCAELEAKICALAEEMATDPGCAGHKVVESGISFDYTSQLMAKREALSVYRQMWTDKKCGDTNEGGIYEFVHIACTKPVDCVGSSCRTRYSQRKHRRYYR